MDLPPLRSIYMAFCARYDSRSKYLNEIDEIIIPFHGTTQNLPEFLEAHSNQRIILDIKEPWKAFFTTIFTPIAEKYTNIALRFPELTADLVAILQNLKIPYFSTQIVVEWELFNELLEKGVSDIYISEQLGFELDKISKVVAKHKIRTRIFPNIAQAARADTDPLKKFFIRPEDIDLYNRRYISTFEFYIPEDLDLNWDVLYRAYAINKKWNGPLSEIILGLDNDIVSTFMSPHWGEFRMDCARKCLQGHSCNMCNILYDFSKSLEKIEIMPKPPIDTKQAAKIIMEHIDNKTLDAETPTPIPQIPNF